MKTNMLAGHTRYSVQAIVLGSVFALLLLFAISAAPQGVQAAEDTGSGTVPPLARFIHQASPAAVQQGEVVTYEVTIINTETTYVNVTIGVTSTLPTGVVVISDTIQTNLGEADINAAGQITWTGAIQQPGNIFISYQARVDTDTCGEKISQAVLYEVENPGAGGPTDKQLTNDATFMVEGDCKVYLSSIIKSLTPISSLQNWNFEEGPEAAGWGQFDNDQPSTLIYSTDRKALPMPQGGKWFGWLGGVLDKRSELRQPTILPADHSGIELRFLYLIESAEDCGADKDNGYVLLGGVQIGDVYELCANNVTSDWQAAKISVPSTLWSNESTLILRSVTNLTKNSNWFVDNVQFCSTDERAAAADRCP